MAKLEDEKSFNKKIADQDAKRAEVFKDLEEAKERLRKMALTPYAFSNLDQYLKLESWYWKDALLLLAGALPIGADVNWDGYYNYCNVLINQPEIVNIGFIDCRLPEYDVPSDYSYGDDDNHFRGDKLIEEKIYQLRSLQASLGDLYTFWINAIEPHKDRNPPNFYIEWALSKNLHIEWLDWAIEKGYYTPKAEVLKESQELKPRERETMIKLIHALARNGYRYPSHGSIKDMVKDFQLNSNGVSEKTLKKYLDEFDSL